MNAALTLAEQHDLAGRHDDAVNALARATQAGDLDAMTELGKRLVIGDRAPLLPADGARFLRDAAAAGHAEAAVRLATLAALGAHVPQDWNEAFGLLVFAAERGSESARGQLQTLAGAPPASGEDPAHWRRLAEAVELRKWLTPPAGTTLCASPLVRMFPEFVTDAVCAWLIERARPELKRALIYDPVGGKDKADHMRTNSAAGFDLVHADVVQVVVQSRISAAIGIPIQHMEGPTILHYAPGEQITNHYDFVNPILTTKPRSRSAAAHRRSHLLEREYEAADRLPQLARFPAGSAAAALQRVAEAKPICAWCMPACRRGTATSGC
jgi:hypothetical protein